MLNLKVENTGLEAGEATASPRDGRPGARVERVDDRMTNDVQRPPQPIDRADRANASGYAADYGPDAGGPSDSDVLEPRLLFSILRRRKYLILGIAFLITTAATLVVGQLTPLYFAEAEVVIDPNRQNVVDIDRVAQGLSSDWLTTRTEADVLGSRELAKRVVRQLNLIEHPAFNPALDNREPNLLDSLEKIADGLLVSLGLREPPRASAPPDRERLVERVTSRFLRGLTIEPSRSSRVIAIHYVSHNRRAAAMAANAVADSYIEGQLTTKGEVTSQASVWLEGRVKELQERVIESEQKLAAFRRTSGLTDVDGTSIPARQMAQFNTQLINARTALSEATTRADQIQRLLRNGGDISSAAAVLNSALIQNLRVEEITLNRKIAELGTKYRAAHPKMINAVAELKDLREKIAGEVRKIAANLRNEAEVARARVDNLEIEVAGLRTQLNQMNQDEVILRSLEVEVGANRQLYETLLQRLKETGVQDETTQRADARVITRAIPASKPFYPRSRLVIGMALMASLVLGVGLALVLEFLDTGFRSLAQVEKQTGLPTLGMIPLIKGRRRDRSVFLGAATSQGAIYTEAIRALRTSLMLSNAETPPRLVLVTSAVPNEGKTTTVLSIASQSVQSGRRCIVVDCDLRQSNIGAALGQPQRLGLSDYLIGEASLDDVIAVDDRTGLHFIAAGSGSARPVEMLGSPRMKTLLESLSDSYQMVFLDTPPLLAVSDALVLLREAEATVFLVRWEKTNRDTAKAGLKRALESGARIAGVVLTQVDVRRHAQYHYADSHYYYSKSYQKYYANS